MWFSVSEFVIKFKIIFVHYPIQVMKNVHFIILQHLQYLLQHLSSCKWHVSNSAEC